MEMTDIKDIRKRYNQTKKAKIIKYTFVIAALSYLIIYIAPRLYRPEYYALQGSANNGFYLFLLLLAFKHSIDIGLIWRDYKVIDKVQLFITIFYVAISLVFIIYR